MLVAVPYRMLPWAKEGSMGFEDRSGTEPLAHTELWGGLDRDLERLQTLLDGAVDELTRAFAAVSDVASGNAPAQTLRETFSREASRVITCLQFHDIATQMIANMRSRAELLEMAALTTGADSAVEARSRLLADALRISKGRPEIDFDKKSGDVDLF